MALMLITQFISDRAGHFMNPFLNIYIIICQQLLVIDPGLPSLT